MEEEEVTQKESERQQRRGRERGKEKGVAARRDEEFLLKVSRLNLTLESNKMSPKM